MPSSRRPCHRSTCRPASTSSQEVPSGVPDPSTPFGLRSLVFSDGGAGVRGEGWSASDPSVCFPSLVALGCTWDAELTGRLAAEVAMEAKRKGVDVVLAPTPPSTTSATTRRRTGSPSTSASMSRRCARSLWPPSSTSSPRRAYGPRPLRQRASGISGCSTWPTPCRSRWPRCSAPHCWPSTARTTRTTLLLYTAGAAALVGALIVLPIKKVR
jgi:hypothetical protein